MIAQVTRQRLRSIHVVLARVFPFASTKYLRLSKNLIFRNILWLISLFDLLQQWLPLVIIAVYYILNLESSPQHQIFASSVLEQPLSDSITVLNCHVFQIPSFLIGGSLDLNLIKMAHQSIKHNTQCLNILVVNFFLQIIDA